MAHGGCQNPLRNNYLILLAVVMVNVSGLASTIEKHCLLLAPKGYVGSWESSRNCHGWLAIQWFAVIFMFSHHQPSWFDWLSSILVRHQRETWFPVPPFAACVGEISIGWETVDVLNGRSMMITHLMFEAWSAKEIHFSAHELCAPLRNRQFLACPNTPSPSFTNRFLAILLIISLTH